MIKHTKFHINPKFVHCNLTVDVYLHFLKNYYTFIWSSLMKYQTVLISSTQIEKEIRTALD